MVYIFWTLFYIEDYSINPAIAKSFLQGAGPGLKPRTNPGADRCADNQIIIFYQYISARMIPNIMASLCHWSQGFSKGLDRASKIKETVA
jgi:hypothetical protein